MNNSETKNYIRYLFTPSQSKWLGLGFLQRGIPRIVYFIVLLIFIYYLFSNLSPFSALLLAALITLSVSVLTYKKFLYNPVQIKIETKKSEIIAKRKKEYNYFIYIVSLALAYFILKAFFSI